jgi:hypothetical protein
MIAWLARILLLAAGAVTAWFIAEDAPNFDVVQGIVAMLLLALIVAALAFGPTRWTAWRERLRKPPP